MGPRILLAALALTAAAPGTASAVDTFRVGVGGSISPGLDLALRPQSLSASGALTAATGTYPCAFTGAETASLAVAAGTWRGGCGPYSCGSWVVVRAGVSQHMVCFDAEAADPPVLAMDCVWTPGQVNPTTAFSLLCAGAMERVFG